MQTMSVQNLDSKAQDFRRILPLGIVSIILGSVLYVQAQAFQNLDFEAATVPQTQAPGLVNVTAALPGWNAFAGPDQLTHVLFNEETLGTTSVSLLGTNGPGPLGKSIEGAYSVLLQGKETAPGASISQTAVVPALTQSILFMAQPDVVPETLLVSLGSQNIPVFTLGTGPNYTLYGGDIPPPFAGQLEELQFSAPDSFTGPNDWVIDSITFSPNPIPEPRHVDNDVLWGGSSCLRQMECRQ